MSPEIIKILITGVLFLQAFSHGVAFFALLKDARAEGKPPLPVRSWLRPPSPQRQPHGARFFWFLATIGFLATAVFFWEAPTPSETWRLLAAAAALISTLGIALFSGIWPGAPDRRLSNIDTVIALVINAAVLVLSLVGWPPGTLFGG